MIARKPALPVALFFVFSWLHMLVTTAPFYHTAAPQPGLHWDHLFHLLAWNCYSFIYLVPALLLTLILQRLTPRQTLLHCVFAVLCTTLSLGFILADRTIYDLYNFHFNGFVWNLLLTPGGVASLGSGSETYLTAAWMVARLLLLQIVFVVASFWLNRIQAPSTHWRGLLLTVFAVALLTEQVIYGIGDIYNNAAILDTADVYPLYKRTTFLGLANKLGLQPQRQEKLSAKVNSGRLHYPLTPIIYAAVPAPPNIIILATESLRWDRLTADIMPNTWQFAQTGQHFTRHYSSGNGTREGLFGMFYGLYGSYWASFLHAQQSPLLMDRLQALNYQLELRTSARFSYPEFNKTLFANVPLAFQHENEYTGKAWENDRDNTTALLSFIERRDLKRPFMVFMFYEAPHARYAFPDSSVIRRPYLETVNYADMSRQNLAQHADELRNRYTNAANSVDVQLGRIYAYLAQQHLLENTVVIVTGDHGEEFMEKGFWGHNSSFVEEQTHTPLVTSMPGKTHEEIDRPTSHLDISVTLLQLLGAQGAVDNYALGRNLFDESPRPYWVISDWHSLGVVTSDMKYRIPYTHQGIDNYPPTKPDDSPYPADQQQKVLTDHRAIILDAIHNTSRFIH